MEVTQPQTSSQPGIGVRSTEPGRKEPTDTRDVNLTSALRPLRPGLTQQCSINQPILTFPASDLSPGTVSSSPRMSLASEECCVHWESLLSTHCAPDSVLGLDKHCPSGAGGWALPSCRLHRVRKEGSLDLLGAYMGSQL